MISKNIYYQFSKRCKPNLALRNKLQCNFSTSLPGDRIPMLRQMLETYKHKRPVRVLETHNGLTGLIAENVSVEKYGET